MDDLCVDGKRLFYVLYENEEGERIFFAGVLSKNWYVINDEVICERMLNCTN